jgi:hypothetical protein
VRGAITDTFGRFEVEGAALTVHDPITLVPLPMLREESRVTSRDSRPGRLTASDFVVRLAPSSSTSRVPKARGTHWQTIWLNAPTKVRGRWLGSAL